MPDDRPARRLRIPPLIFDVLLAVAVLVIVFGALFAYTGNWPPLVVVESRSMQHADGESFVGVMDTGDFVLVKKVTEEGDITTYYEGVLRDYQTYGDYGDVIVFWRGGSQAYTPIIHRAVLFLEAGTGDYYISHELGDLVEGEDYSLSNPGDSWDRITGDIRLFDYGYQRQELILPIGDMIAEINRAGAQLRDGFITKGDLNPQTDQLMGIANLNEPIPLEWVIGRAEGELPWFGILKLWVSGTLPDYTPPNSIGALVICVGVILAVPISVELLLWQIGLRKQAGEETNTEKTPPEGNGSVEGAAPEEREVHESEQNPPEE